MVEFVYNQDLQEIESRLQRLKERGLLDNVDIGTQRISVHELYREFALLEAKGKLSKSADFEKRKWVYCEDAKELEATPSIRCWQNLIRIGILRPPCNWYVDEPVQCLKGVEWRNFANVVVLKLFRLGKLQGELNLEGLKRLRSLELIEIGALDTLDGLQDLNNLTYFMWMFSNYTYGKPVQTRIGKLLYLGIGVLLRPDVFAHCTKLSKLGLRGCRAENLDFKTCTSLQTVTLERLGLLETLWGLSTSLKSSLQSLTVSCCADLIEISGLDHLVSLQQLYLHGNPKFKELPNLQLLTRLQVLHVSSMDIEEVPGLDSLRQLPRKCSTIPAPKVIASSSGPLGIRLPRHWSRRRQHFEHSYFSDLFGYLSNWLDIGTFFQSRPKDSPES